MTKDQLAAMGREYTTGLWWFTFLRTWATLADVLHHETAIKYHQAEIARYRAEHVRRGRPKGPRGVNPAT